MKPTCILVFLLCFTLTVMAQKSVTLNVESLKKPEHVLRVQSYQNILEDMIRSDNGVSRSNPDGKPAYTSFNIVAKSNITDSLVNSGYHPFFDGMYHAYADHRPFTLSPDMIWLLICQGFSNHVNNNSESLRSMFVNFKGKNTLVVRNNEISLNNPNSPWEEVFPEFSKQISEYTGKELTETLTADFSTTTPVTKIASQITLMDAMKSYFDFMVITIGCGIPQITLEGSQADWQKVLTKTEALRKYKLDWWVDEMEPILKEMVKATSGKVNKDFWQTMFKYHSKNGCGAPTIVDGWIVKFFPYDKFGKRNNLDSLNLGHNNLPNEVVKVDVDYIYGNGAGDFVKTPLEFWAGFVGLKQNNSNYNLRPEIGWMIHKKDTTANTALMARLKKEDSGDGVMGGIMLHTATVPKELLEIGPIHFLTIYFAGDIDIPDAVGKINIDNFRMYGKITDEGISRIRKLLPNTGLIINNKKIDK